MKMKKNYSEKQKSEIISRYLSGNSVTKLSAEYDIARSTIYKWIGKSDECEKQKRKVNMCDFFDLKQRCEQQELMIEILQNAPCTVNSSLAKRYDYILNSSEKYSVNLLCKTMKVAKGSYYNHVLRNKMKTHNLKKRSANLHR